MQRLIHPRTGSRKLHSLAHHLGIPLENRHRARDDAYATARILVELLRLLREKGVRTVGEIKLFEWMKGRQTWTINVTARRTKVDWAIEVAHLLDTRYAACEQVTLVCDNLNTHTKGAFYTAFPPAQARAYIKRINFCHTPKQGPGWPPSSAPSAGSGR